MAIFIKRDGTWKETNMYYKTNAGWKELLNLFTKINGLWKPIYKYTWSAGAWGTCSVTCGGGTQSRPVTCMRNSLGVADKFCIASNVTNKPNESQTCNTQSCAPIRYNFTGRVQYYSISPYTKEVEIHCYGAGGGRQRYTSNDAKGGDGGYTYAILNVEGLTTLYVYVGRAGYGAPYSSYGSSTSYIDDTGPGSNSGGGAYGGRSFYGDEVGSGGGSSDVRTIEGNSPAALLSRLVVAGGGGGSGYYGNGTHGNIAASNLSARAYGLIHMPRNEVSGGGGGAPAGYESYREDQPSGGGGGYIDPVRVKTGNIVVGTGPIGGYTKSRHYGDNGYITIKSI